MNRFGTLHWRMSGLAALWLLVAASGASAQDRIVFGAWPMNMPPLPTDPAWRFMERPGDGLSGLFIFRLSTYHPIYHASNTGSGFKITGGLEWFVEPLDFYRGDFNGDGLKDDFLDYDPATGTFWVDLETEGIGTRTVWATTGPIAAWQIAVGDYSGDGRDDVMLYNPATGTIQVGRSLGSSFAFSLAGSVLPPDGWLWVSGRFTGTATDIAGYHPSNDTLWIGDFIPQQAQFHFFVWGVTTPHKFQQLQAGDFNQDGRTDVIGYDGASPGRDLVVGLSTGSSFAVKRWGSAPGPGLWRFTAGRFLGDAQTDVVGYDGVTGTFSMGHNVQTQCNNDFDDDGDGKADWDGGGIGDPDPQCAGDPARKAERSCGLGAELAVLLPLLRRWRRARPGAPRPIG